MEVYINKSQLKVVGIICYLVVCGLFGTSLILDNPALFTPALGATLYNLLLGLGLLLLFRILSIKIHLNKISISFLILYFGISLSFITNAKFDQHIISELFSIILLPFLTVSLVSDKITNYIFHYLSQVPNFVYEKIVGPFTLLGEFKERSFRVENKNALKEVLKTLLLFVFIGVPLLLIVSVLLSIASQSFTNILRPVLDWIVNLFRIDFMTFTRVALFVFIMFYFGGEIAFVKTFKEKILGVAKIEIQLQDFPKYVLNFVVLLLITLNIILGVFALADINTDLIGGVENHRENLLVKGYDSYSSYAVSRFTEIMIVSVINIIIIYFIQKYLQSKSTKFNKVLKVNVIILLIANLMLVFSAFQRLNLYISGYGLTEKRFDSLVILFVITFISSILMISVVTNKLRSAFELTFLIIAVTTVSLLILPTHYIIYNLNSSLSKSGKIVVYDPNYGANYNGCQNDSKYSTHECKEVVFDDFRKWFIKY